MRILEIVSATKINGAIKHCHDLTLQLQKLGHEMHVACLPESWMSRQMTKHGVPVIETSLQRWPHTELNRVTEYIREHEIQLVHTHMSKAHFFGVLLRWFAGTPSVATAHSRLFQLHWMLNDRVIAVSEATRRFHMKRNFVKSNQIETVHNFVDIGEPPQISADERAEFRKANRIREDARIIAFAGEITTRKGLIYLVRALPDILKNDPNATVVVVGAPTERGCKAKFCREARRLGVLPQMRFLGRRNDIPRILAMSDIFVLPSLEESLPLTILEAMSCRLPVVASAVGGVPESVVDGETGFLVDSKNPSQLAQRISTLLLNPRLCEQMGHRGREFAVDNFSPIKQLTKIEDVFQRTIGKRMKTVAGLAKIPATDFPKRKAG